MENILADTPTSKPILKQTKHKAILFDFLQAQFPKYMTKTINILLEALVNGEWEMYYRPSLTAKDRVNKITCSLDKTLADYKSKPNLEELENPSMQLYLTDTKEWMNVPIASIVSIRQYESI